MSIIYLSETMIEHKDNIISLRDRPHLHFALRDGHTLGSIKEDAQHYANHGEPFICRHGWAGGHDWQMIGDVWTPPAKSGDINAIFARYLSVLASGDTNGLRRCTRCRRVSMRSRF
jgi:hypothetical protein